MSQTANPSATIHKVSGPSRYVIGTISRLVRLWQGTLHYDITQLRGKLSQEEGPGHLVLLWHNRLFPCIGALMQAGLKQRRLYGLVSASRDGAQMAHYLEGQGIYPIRGSSSRRGSVATRELLRILGDGHHVAISVDGPRGPCYHAQAGAALLAQKTHAPMFFAGAECESCWTLRSWDRFIVPRPFSRVRVPVLQYIHPSFQGGREERLFLQSLIQEKLDSLTLDLHRPAELRQRPVPC